MADLPATKFTGLFATASPTVLRRIVACLRIVLLVQTCELALVLLTSADRVMTDLEMGRLWRRTGRADRARQSCALHPCLKACCVLYIVEHFVVS
jgi:hypothetical protein